ncbi:DUF1571 domain-containing protein [Caballeronia sp. 15715]|uniref:DUF1571 domain-containing protein n=1 Tax=Caballeronia sp. 15715 TaxID=3391030 RepID=UPI0039E226F5
MHRARARRQNSKLIRACAWVPALLAALALSAVTMSMPANAQQAASTAMAALPTSAATSAAGPALSTNATSTPPKTPAAQVGKLPLDGQVRWLTHAARSGMLANMSDTALVSLFKSLDPLTVPRYLKNGPNGYPSYEFSMLRRERIHGMWPSQEDHMLVRVTRDPLRVYAKWLPDGGHAGQEILYDETARPNEMYGHLGGLLKVIAIWTSLDGSLARSQSRHSVRDLGTEYITQQFLAEGKKFADAGVTRANNIEVKTIDGARVVAFTYETPSGQPDFYAKKEILGLDLRRPYFRTAESFDNDGKIFESIVFQNIAPKTFDDAAFNPKNPAYNF